MATTAKTTKKTAAKKATTARKTTAKKATTARKTTAKRATTARKATAKKATTARKTTARKVTTATKRTTAAAKPAVSKAAKKPASQPLLTAASEARDNLIALLPFELPKFELPFELPKVELPKLEDVQSRFEDFVIDLRERTNSGELRKGVETAVEKVRATVGR